MPAEKVEITAEFERIPEYQITVKDTEGGTVTVDTESAKEGETIVFHIAAADGCLFKGVTVSTESGKTVEVTEADGVYSFLMPAENAEITAVFEKIPEYQIAVSMADGGTVTTDVKTAKEGETVSIRAAAADGYELSGVSVRTESGQAVSVTGANGSYSFIMPAGNVTVAGAFQKKQQSVNTDNSQKEEEARKEQEKLLAEKKAFQAKKASLKNVKAQKKKAAVTWKKVKDAEGYVIEYALKSNFKGKKKVMVKKGTTLKKTVKKLKSGKRYFVRIRAYRTIGGKKIYTKYSAKKKVTVK